MQAIKAVVIILAVLIVIALGAVIWAIFNINDDDGNRSSRETGGDPADWKLSLDLPSGCDIAAVEVVGRRLAVQTAGATGTEGCGHIYIVDPSRGTITGTVTP